MTRIFFYIALISFSLSNLALPLNCDEVLNLCEDAVISQESTIRICEEMSKQKDDLINTTKEQTIITEKNLSNQELATVTGFSLSGFLLLLLLL